MGSFHHVFKQAENKSVQVCIHALCGKVREALPRTKTIIRLRFNDLPASFLWSISTTKPRWSGSLAQNWSRESGLKLQTSTLA